MKEWLIDDRWGGGQAASGIFDRLVACRGAGGEGELEGFLTPRLKNLADPLRLPDIEKAASLVDEALRSRLPILVYTDYDVDGMTSGALLYRFLVELGADVEVFIPERINDGYGLSLGALERACAARQPKLLIALDCGTTSLAEVAWLKERGVGVVILDHHELAEELPAADAFVNPQRNGHDHGLASVGIVFKFCHAFLKLRNEPGLFDLQAHLDLVAMGTVADMVPLLEDNRVLVAHGLRQLAQTRHVGLRVLMEVAGMRRQPTPGTIGFVLGPRLNASGRLAEASAGWRLLVTNDHDEAYRIARELDNLNRERQKLEHTAWEEAERMAAGQPVEERSHCVVVAADGWHQGVVGIVASRLQRAHYKPAIVISLDGPHGKGSCRSIEGCSIMDALRDSAGLLSAFGGHPMAAGIEIEREQVPEFRRRMNRWLAGQVDASIYNERVRVDLEVPVECLTESLARDLGRLEPFGQKNEPPVFAVRGVRLARSPRVFSERHLRFRAAGGGNEFDAVGFGFAQRGRPPGAFDMAGHWSIDDYTGQPCFRMLDWRW